VSLSDLNIVQSRAQLVTLQQERRVPLPGDPHHTSRTLNKRPVTMTIEYLVLLALPENGPFASVIAGKVKQSWDTLQDALDELGQQGWDLCTTIYGPTRERGGPGEHYCEGFIFKRTG
jgi:hypothetical protein